MISRPQNFALVLLLTALLAGCGDDVAVRHGSPMALYPAKTETYRVEFPALATIRDEFLTFVVNTNGMEGLLDLVQAGFGVDLSQENVLEDAGLDPAMELLFMEYRGASALSLGITSKDDFLEAVRAIVASRGQQVKTTVTDGPDLYRVTESVAWTVQGDVLTLLYDPADEATALLASLVLESRESDDSPTEQLDGSGDNAETRFHYRFSAKRSLESDAAEQLASMGTLGGVGHALLQFLDSCSEVRGTLSTGERYRLEAEAAGCTVDSGVKIVLKPEALVPADTIVLLHWSSSSDTLWDRFSNIQKLILQFAWSQQKRVPKEYTKLKDVLSLFRGEWAVGFIGLSLMSTLETFTAPKDALDPLFGLHLQFILPLVDGADVGPLFAKKPLALFHSFALRDLSTESVAAREFCRERKDVTMCFAYALKDSVLHVVTGVGQGARLLRTLDGTGNSLDKALFVSRDTGDITVTVKTRQLVKDLTNKGFPPYFLQLIASVLEARFAVSGVDGDTRLTLEVIPR
jgi:hypothetical protein